MQKKRTVWLSTSLAWPAVAGCSWAETFSQLRSISFAQLCSLNCFKLDLLRGTVECENVAHFLSKPIFKPIRHLRGRKSLSFHINSVPCVIGTLQVEIRSNQPHLSKTAVTKSKLVLQSFYPSSWTVHVGRKQVPLHKVYFIRDTSHRVMKTCFVP